MKGSVEFAVGHLSLQYCLIPLLKVSVVESSGWFFTFYFRMFNWALSHRWLMSHAVVAESVDG